ncbi:phage tail protein [Rhodococcus sp. WB1]|uniref:Phage tail sheath subtilisin-like domain-containing protein n=1 Tax=Rhodococcus aetherivorans TaxID=191292 RepID=A0AA46SF58_9NOCA|nr:MULTISPECIES: phage tail sheath subtilisin-like domain-containing protein [Rhodococcus]ANZ23949.1 phage tail protein [Rhodococcus sp. WB1]MDV6293470.1 phage tail sheath subtilisin-like domain-containing protein [Rhodococcus aetherivorans]UGQ42501.1 phage tail sheath subtilisin-like domain-containing protein [Rhodococcus aetherivorans]UYF95687.1 phage tail sheath subtilisin-like domain-containing protein [Rhodococcus aetherivorans]
MPTYLSPGVYVEEVDSGSRPIEGVGTAVAAFVGLSEKGLFNEPTLVSNWTQFTGLFGGFVDGACLARSVYAYFQNGGGNAYIVRIGDSNGNSGSKSAPKPVEAAPQGILGNFRVLAIDPAAAESGIEVEVVPSDAEPADGTFKLVVRRGGETVEEHSGVTPGRGKTNAATVVNGQSRTIKLEQIPNAQASDELAVGKKVTLAAPAQPALLPSAQLTTDDYVGDVSERTGFSGLEAIDEITMICVPDLVTAYQRSAIDLDTVISVQQAMIAHCELMGDRMAILDPPPGLNAQQIKEWKSDKANYDSKYATLYWPWVSTDGGTYLPPSGFVAGVWARNDDTRGVHKAPANEVLRGVVSLQTQITRNEHDLLNPVGINCIRSFPGRGIRVWGARTLSSDPAWRYLNIRRLFNYLEESILNGTDWVVFEPNDQALWAKLRRTISAFLVNEWRKGALFGSTPDEAFYVKCDEETNPAEGIDAGEVVCLIGVAPVKPAEFVIFRLSQFSGGTSLVAE